MAAGDAIEVLSLDPGYLKMSAASGSRTRRVHTLVDLPESSISSLKHTYLSGIQRLPFGLSQCAQGTQKSGSGRFRIPS